MNPTFRTPSPALDDCIMSAHQTPITFPDARQERLNADMTNGCLFEKGRDFRDEVTTSLPLYTSRPQTPKTEQMKRGWHGLLSPQTPSCKGALNAKQPRSYGLEDDSDTEGHAGDLWTSEPSERDPSSGEMINLPDPLPSMPSASIRDDEKLAVQLSGSCSIRRSTRLREKVKPQAANKPKSRIKVTKPATAVQAAHLKEVTSPILTQSEPTRSPFEVAITDDTELPALHSVQWQLMYPPGGSTHPAYPWPPADPRLVFQTHHVPLNGGLPDVCYVPRLTLPIGWHHACWSGLHPVVFDPYKQAFKLTPVGPVPLTCEEVHQGGLQDYVPGGKAHPEFGLLPLPLILSDGSDAEVYNFDGIDWVLPWVRFDGDPDIDSSMSALFSGSPPFTSSGVIAVDQPSPRYVEARDCPDDVFDLQDGWRWICEMEQMPPGTFTPTPGRRWFGTGVLLTARQTKQPIAALMAITMSERVEDNPERYLGKQNMRNFCPFKSVATPVHIDIRLMGDTEFTLVELLWFFPNHYQWRKAGERMVRAGLSAVDISGFVNMSRLLPGGSTCTPGSVSYQVFRKTHDDGAEDAMQARAKTTSYTAERWTYDVWETADYPLLALTHGLVEMPMGSDSGPLTSLIRWVRDQGRYQTMLSEVPALLREANIEGLIEPGNGVDADREVLARHFGSLKKDRCRVLRESKLSKESVEAKARAAGEVVVAETAKRFRTKKRKLE